LCIDERLGLEAESEKPTPHMELTLILSLFGALVMTLLIPAIRGIFR
jgi:hypothetical protein